ncbi:hypothetical protein [Streptomyces sp. NPDC008001]|uniref:hypothetical protein n=1 Tax=Streptomyces sp. NPDC008001 TaxID=3364804 RepID=UPI0036E8AB09
MSAVIGTWNLENFCRPLPAGSPPNPNKCAAKDHATYDAKVDALADVITEIGPDLLGVQEAGSQEALDDLVAKLPGTWHTALSDHPDPRRHRLGRPQRRMAGRHHPDPVRSARLADGHRRLRPP